MVYLAFYQLYYIREKDQDDNIVAMVTVMLCN